MKLKCIVTVSSALMCAIVSSLSTGENEYET